MINDARNNKLEERGNTNIVLFFSLCAFSSALLVIMVLARSMPFNPLKQESSSVQVLDLIPQGWSFFTRDPQESQLQLYKILDDGELKKIQHYHSHYSNFFGMKRDMSRLMAELTVVFREIDRSCFYDCKSNNQYSIVNPNCFALQAEIYHIKNKFSSPLLCGQYLLTSQKIIPWAWTNKRKNVLMPNKSLVIKIACEEESGK